MLLSLHLDTFLLGNVAKRHSDLMPHSKLILRFVGTVPNLRAAGWCVSLDSSYISLEKQHYKRHIINHTVKDSPVLSAFSMMQITVINWECARKRASYQTQSDGLWPVSDSDSQSDFLVCYICVAGKVL